MSWGPCTSFSSQILGRSGTKLGRSWYEVGTMFDDCGTEFVEISTKYNPEVIIHTISEEIHPSAALRAAEGVFGHKRVYV